jgi:tRNA1Val (adenine37-N6)-methyltransferase
VVLDVGTGCGLLPLMLAQKGVGQVDAVDIDKASIEEATINFEASQWRNQLQAICTNITDYQTDKQYDLIVSNPPFFNNYSKCDSERKSRARHNDVTLSYEALCAVVCRLLKPDGRFALVLPVNASVEFLKVAERNGLLLHKRMIIIPIAGREPNRLNLELQLLKPSEIQETTFVIRDVNNRFTNQYCEYLKDFYLGL